MASKPLISADLSGTVALVTGASGALGRHFAKVLARAGARVALAARQVDACRDTVAKLAESGAPATVVVAMDVTDVRSIADAIAAVEKALGPVTLVINNAGIASNRRSLDLTPGDWDRVLDTNLKGAWMVANEAAKRMIAAGLPGSVVNVASILSFRVAGNVSPYAASKAALLQLTRALALEWARHHIRVNALAPGYIETDLNRDFFATAEAEALIKRIPQRRLGQPEDLDGALLLLACEASRYMTGTCIVVDGGHLQSTL